MKQAALSAVARLVPAAASARARPSARWPVAFGARFYVALLLGLVWTGPAWWDHRFGYAMLGWNVLLLGVWLADLRRLPQPGRLEVTRRWSEPLSLAEPATVTVQVVSEAPVSLRVSLQDDLPPALTQAPPSLELRVTDGQPAEAAYTICPSARGDLKTGGVYLRYQSPLRFAERWALAELAQNVRVYPNLRESQQSTLYLIRSRQIELEKRLKRNVGAGREFESLRDYREGDGPRDICWTATARRGKLITRTYQAERSQRVMLVVDAGRLLLARVRPTEQAAAPIALTKLDHAVNAALALARVALYSGDTVGLLAYSRRLQASLAAGRGTHHLRNIVEGLAAVQGELIEADHERAAAHLLATEKRRCLVIWLTDLAETASTPDVIEAAARLLPRHLVLFAAISQPDLNQLAARRPESVAEAYRYVAAQETVQRRELLLRRLRQQGALAMEIEPGRLSAGLVSQYLEIKERSLL